MTETNVTALEQSARIMFYTLNTIFQLHDMAELEPDEGDKAIEGCAHCSDLAGVIVHYPCPTVQILTNDMAVEPATSGDEAETSESTSQE